MASRGERPWDIGDWLRGFGLGQYEATFRQNEVNESVLPKLTQEDLREIGVGPVGHRRLILDAIATLRAGTDAKAAPPEAPATVLQPAQDTAERRQVTVMFSDLVGSTALSARMDPEDLREIISAYQKCVFATARRFGGFVAKYMGDGVLVYFGYPQAHEDDAESAVRAGLELVAAVSALRTRASLQTRAGIATGLVVVGDLIGSGEAQERGIVGETPNLAARLQGLAEPNSVVIAESTRKLLGNLFELEDLGARDLKGISGPVRAWTALRPSGVESRFEALRTATTPLIGRDEELDLLLRRWEQAKRGDGCVVLISASPVLASGASLRLSWNGSVPSHTRGYAISARRITRTAPSIQALRSSSGRQASDAKIRPSNGSPSWRQSLPKGPMTSVRPYLCPRRRALLAAQSHPAETQGEDAARPIDAARRTDGPSTRFDGVGGRALE
jgi:class 3 adenylate cyclase